MLKSLEQSHRGSNTKSLIKTLAILSSFFVYIAVMYAPENKKMGHAGAIVSGNMMGTVKSKVKALEAARVTACPTVGKIVEFIEKQNLKQMEDCSH